MKVELSVHALPWFGRLDNEGGDAAMEATTALEAVDIISFLQKCETSQLVFGFLSKTGSNERSISACSSMEDDVHSNKKSRHYLSKGSSLCHTVSKKAQDVQ